MHSSNYSNCTENLDTNGTQTMILCVAECQLRVAMGYSMRQPLLNFNTDETQHIHDTDLVI